MSDFKAKMLKCTKFDFCWDSPGDPQTLKLHLRCLPLREGGEVREGKGRLKVVEGLKEIEDKPSHTKLERKGAESSLPSN